jgi:cell shape-determining protein MreD
MTSIDALGYLAAALVLATFTARSMVALRALAIGSNIAFIAYGLSAALWPILLLHSIMLPLNLLRLREALGSAPALAIGLRSLDPRQMGFPALRRRRA